MESTMIEIKPIIDGLVSYAPTVALAVGGFWTYFLSSFQKKVVEFLYHFFKSALEKTLFKKKYEKMEKRSSVTGPGN